MAISLTYLSESIFAAMVNRKRTAFLSLAGLSELSDPSFVENTPDIASYEVQLAPAGKRSFDGASRVDTIVRLRPGVGAAFELKLGTTRLTQTRIDEEWLTPCEPSHAGRRWRGNMMAILERKFSEAVDDDLVALVDKERIVLARQWFVVARKKVVASWIAAPPSFSKNVRFLAFEDVVDVFGGKSAFNALVREMLDFDFYREWVENESPAGP